ncbi:MAG: TPM domain-containing protein [Bacillota bacterium]|jgi:uncharacterized protein
MYLSRTEAARGVRQRRVARAAACAVLCLFLFAATVQAAPPEVEFPEPLGLVNDYANVIDSASEQAIWQVAANLWQEKGIELAVVTVDTTAPLDIYTYSYRLFKEWGIGDQHLNNGLLVLLSVGEREINVEVGLGLEGDLNDAKVGRVLDRAVPQLAEHQFGPGLLTVSEQLAIELSQVEGEGKSLWSGMPQVGGIAVFGSGYLLAIILAAIFRQNWLLYLLLRLPASIMFGGRGRRGGGGFGGGGFGGFGGGRSGGGGASRRF